MLERKCFHKLLLLTTQLILIIQDCECSLYPYQISSGLYEDSTDTPIFYESFLPIVYEFAAPTWKNLDITLRDWRGLCQTDEFAPSYTCPVFFYLERFIERLQSEVVPPSNIATTGGMTPSLLNSTIADKCDRIQRHFPSAFTSKSNLDDYIAALSSCHLQGGDIKRNLTNYLYDIKIIFKNMVAKFENEFSTKAGVGTLTDRQGPAYYVNQITASQGIMLFNYWVEHTRWENAKRDCALQRIPSSLIKHLNFTESLKKVEEEAKKQKYILSIPLSEATAYFSHPLADCTHTESTFAVRILVPVRKKSFSGRLVNLMPVPFLLNDNQEKYSLCQIYDMDEKSYIYDDISGYLVESPYGHQPRTDSNLIQVENWSKTSLPNLCAAAYFSRNLMNIKKHCRFVCEQVVDGLYSVFPLFRRVSSDTYVVTGNSNTEVVIKCEGKRDQFVNPVKLGSLQITLPCHCSLNFRSEMFLPGKPCGDNLQSIVALSITPIQFFNLDFIANNDLASTDGPSGSTFNFSGILDKNMMEPRLFNQQKFRLPSQIDVETGLSDLESIGSESDENWGVRVMKYSSTTTTTYSQGAVTWLWILFVIQLVSFLVFVVVVSKKLGILQVNSRFHGEGGILSFRRRHFTTSTENIIAAEHSRGNPQNDEHYRV